MIFMIVLFLIAIIGPFAIAAWALFNEARSRRPFYSGPASSLVDPAEQKALHQFDAELGQINKSVDRVFARGHGLHQRSDGLFDERSYKGRDLNSELYGLFSRRSSVQTQRETLARRIGGRIGGWLSARSQLFGARAALLTYVAVFCFIGLNGTSSAAATSNVFAFSDPASDSARIAASLGATSLAAIAMLIATLIRRATLKQTF